MTTLLGAEHTPTAKVLITVGFIAGLAISAFWVFFIAAEMVSDPGGWFGVTYAGALIIPILGLGAWAWFAPRSAAVALSILIAAFVVANLVTMFFGTQWAGFEDTHGPVGLVVGVALCVPTLVLGRARPMIAGALLLVATVVPIVVSLVQLFSMIGTGRIGGGISLLTVGMPFILAGILFLIAGASDRRSYPGT